MVTFASLARLVSWPRLAKVCLLMARLMSLARLASLTRF